MINIKPFLQSSSYCGPACLKMIFAYYGLNISERKIGQAARTTIKSGTSPKNLVSAAKHLGFKAYYKENSTIQDLRNLVVDRKTPVIVDWFSEDDGHYSVVVGFANGKIFLQDPEIGKLRSMNISDFMRVWFDFEGDYLKSRKDLSIRGMIAVFPKRN